MPDNQVVLGDRRFAIEPFNIGQIERVVPLLGSLTNATASDAFAAGLSLLVIALEGKYPEVTEKSLREMRSTSTEITAALQAVGRVGGFLPDSIS